MGCHTWFKNKIADMPQEHFDRIRESQTKCIKSYYIYKSSPEQYINDKKKIISDMEKWYGSDFSRWTDDEKWEYNYLKKSASMKHYKKERGKYVKYLEILENPKSTKEQLLRVFQRNDTLFDNDLKNGYYSLSGLGWGDNYRVSGYPTVTHHNAEEAIRWLEEYDNGNGNITYENKIGMCDEIREIIRDFFSQFPNGTIHYG